MARCACHEQRRVPDAPGQAEEPLPQLARRLMLCPDQIELPQPHQRDEELRSVAHLSTEMKRPV
jgi:hypothetical protein